MPIEPFPIEQSYLLDVGFVTRCTNYLRTQKIHRQFPGYLCICHTAALEGRNEKLKPNFKAFFERFLIVSEHPDATPYVVPFNESGTREANVWLNSNVAGSYAVSSLRSPAPLRRVAELFGSGKTATFSLKDEHEEACLEYLLYGNSLNVVLLAGFLLRDHAFFIQNGHTLEVADLANELYKLLGFDDKGFSRIIFHEDDDLDYGQIWAPIESQAKKSAS